MPRLGGWAKPVDQVKRMQRFLREHPEVTIDHPAEDDDPPEYIAEWHDGQLKHCDLKYLMDALEAAFRGQAGVERM